MNGKYKVNKVMKSLKIKNCEGFDRIPLRILNEGAENLITPLTRLMQLIYNTKKIPEQWRVAKIVTTHKSGTRDNIALLNRMHILNNKIDKNWINLTVETYKVKCKEKFLKPGNSN